MNKPKTLTLAFLAGMLASHGAVAADSTNDQYDILDGTGDDLTFIRLGNDGFLTGGMCYEDGDLEWFTDGSCSGNSEEMTLTGSGLLGVGTTNPTRALHLANDGNLGIRLEDTTDESFWLDNFNGNFNIAMNDMTPFTIENVDNGVLCRGCIGFNNENPQAPLHIVRSDSVQEFVLLESVEGGGPQDRAMMFLANNGGIRFEFANESLGANWRFQAATGNNDVFEIAKVGTGEIELTLDADGNLDIAGSFFQLSDRNAKQDISSLDGADVLQRIGTLPVSEWAYKDDPATRHIGPMAQDFHAAFGLGKDDRHIAPLDMAGVNMAAIQAQQSQIDELRARNDDLLAELAELRVVLQRTVATLEAIQGEHERMAAR